jgi:ATP-dependent Clp protease ATP-binding subunit ClpA
MFERFSKEARDAVSGAQDEARHLRHRNIGVEHLLISMAAGSGTAGQVLHDHSVTAEALRTRLAALTRDDLDPDALASLGIDLARVREATEARLGPGALDPKQPPMPSGHIPFSKPGKKVLELSLREAVRLKSHDINSGHLLLGVLREIQGEDRESVAVRLVAGEGLDVDALRRETERLVADRAA